MKSTTKFAVLVNPATQTAVESESQVIKAKVQQQRNASSLLFPIPEFFDEKERLFESIASLDYDKARLASMDERKTKGLTKEGSLTYGEVTFDALYRIFKVAQREQDWQCLRSDQEVFVDLGSGAGRPCIAANILFPFRECYGIEILESLHDQAVIAREEYHTMITDGGRDINIDPMIGEHLEVMHGSILDLSRFDWTIGDLILANSTCFTPEMLNQLTELAKNRVKKSAIFVTFTYSLGSPFEILKEDRFEMSWGEADVYYHRLKVENEKGCDTIFNNTASTATVNAVNADNSLVTNKDGVANKDAKDEVMEM